MDTNTGMPNDSRDHRERDVAVPSASASSDWMPSSGRPPKSRAARLLHQLMRRDLATPDALSRFLGISRQRLFECLAGEVRLRLETQRRLADLIVEHVPPLAQEGRRLQLQCDAEERFQSRETTTHMVAPPDRFR